MMYSRVAKSSCKERPSITFVLDSLSNDKHFHSIQVYGR